MILHTLFAGALFLLAAATASSQVTTPPEPGGIEDRKASPAVWSIRSSRGPGVLQVLGSVHVGPRSGWQLSPSVLAMLDSSDGLVVEVDEAADVIGSLEARDDRILLYGMLPVGETLKEHISAELYRDLRAHVARVGRPIEGLDQLRPWMVAVALTVNELDRLGYPSDAGLDVALMRRVRGSKEIIPLETSKQQLTMLDEMSPELQEMMLRDALQQTDDVETYFRNTMNAWRSGDDRQLDTLLFRELGRTHALAPFYERVIFERNISMRERLEALLATGKTYFVVVGAAHVVGERGIVSDMKKRGFRVTRIPSEW